MRHYKLGARDYPLIAFLGAAVLIMIFCTVAGVR